MTDQPAAPAPDADQPDASGAAEEAVRRYLAWLEDPTSAVDTDAIAKAEVAFASATDPIAKLHAAADLERAKATDTTALRAAFVGHARAYAAHADIPVAAFRALGVPDDVLAEAGFALPSARGRRGPAAAPRGREPLTGAAPRVRAPQITVPQLQEVALRFEGPFTLAQLVDRAGGGSPVTARKAVEELVADGQLAALGPAVDHAGPGRAPNRYQTTTPA